ASLPSLLQHCTLHDYRCPPCRHPRACPGDPCRNAAAERDSAGTDEGCWPDRQRLISSNTPHPPLRGTFSHKGRRGVPGSASLAPSIHCCSRETRPHRVIPEAEGHPGPIGPMIVAHGPVLVGPSKTY